jgi:hypothetical protein
VEGATEVASLDVELGAVGDEGDYFGAEDLAAVEAVLAEPPTWSLGADTHLLRLYLLRQQREQLEHEIAEVVGEAVAAGASWADVGERLGVSRQAVSKRYRPEQDSR